LALETLLKAYKDLKEDFHDKNYSHNDVHATQFVCDGENVRLMMLRP